MLSSQISLLTNAKTNFGTDGFIQHPYNLLVRLEPRPESPITEEISSMCLLPESRDLPAISPWIAWV